MRLFTAFDIPASLRETLTTLRDRGDGASLPIRWSSPEQYHTTIRFIGETTSEEATAYRSALRQVDVPPFEAEPYSLDTLPGRRNPRVLMLGLDLSRPLRRLYEAVTSALQAEGLEPEDRSYRPHVTLGRLENPDPEAVHEFLRTHRDSRYAAFDVSAFQLYESTLTPDGAVHDVVETYPLTADPHASTG